MSSPMALEKVSLVTNQFGDSLTFAAVLGDWFRFLGGKPGEVIVADCGSDDATQAEYRRLVDGNWIDKLLAFQPGSTDQRSNKETGYIQEYAAIAAAGRPYILFFHADTLPYRQGHDDWLEQALAYLERDDVFAVTGSLNLPAFQGAAWEGWFFSNKCSLNFALLKRNTLMRAIHEYAGAFILSGFRGENPAHSTRQDRYLIEVACERYMQQQNMFALTKIEDPTWTIYHTNVHGPRLQIVRADYLKRKNVLPFLNLALCTDVARTLDSRYYGQRPPGAVKRLRIRFGRSAAGRPWRAFKQNVARMVR